MLMFVILNSQYASTECHLCILIIAQLVKTILASITALESKVDRRFKSTSQSGYRN